MNEKNEALSTKAQQEGPFWDPVVLEARARAEDEREQQEIERELAALLEAARKRRGRRVSALTVRAIAERLYGREALRQPRAEGISS
jgi:hypothetical protein